MLSHRNVKRMEKGIWEDLGSGSLPIALARPLVWNLGNVVLLLCLGSHIIMWSKVHISYFLESCQCLFSSCNE